MTDHNYLQKNKAAWNRKTALHFSSGFYDVPSFLAGKSSLNEIELSLLGKVAGKKILHLQCHFGLDTLSLARMGAEVTGVDFSEAAITQANKLAKQTGEQARFICCDIYSLPEYLAERFDYVFTSYGTIGWLPDLDKWASIVSRYLAPGGQFIFTDFHPFIWMFDNERREIVFDYFRGEAVVEKETGTYADKNNEETFETVSWNQGLAEVFNALWKQGLKITSFNEYDYSPYDCFSGMTETSPGKFRFKHPSKRIPLVYSLSAIK